MVIRGDVKLNSSPTSGTGDPILTRDATSGIVGEIGTIDTSVYLPTTLTSGYIFVGNGSNIATGVAMSGDVTIDNLGVTAISTGVIVNADINASAAITLTKLAPTTASRALTSDASGYIIVSSVTSTELGYLSGVTSAIQTQLNAKQNTITGAASTITTSNLTVSRLLVSDGSGKVSVSSVTSTEAGYLSGVTSSIQTQLNAKQAAVQYKDEGSNLGTSGGVTNVDFVGAGVTASHSGGTVTVTIPGTANGLPSGGTTGQYLRKSSGTDYDAGWDTFTLSDVTDVTATAGEVNILSGVTATTSEINYLSGVTGNIQTQIDSKLDNVLTENYIFVGNASNQPSALATGANGYVLTSVGGVPTWQPNGVAGTLNEITDVTITAVADGDVLTYDSLSGEWINATPTGGGGGDVVGPASSTDSAIALFDGITGKLLKDSTKVLTTVGGNIVSLANPSAVSFIRVNADNTVTARTPAETLSDIGAWSLASGGTLTAANTITSNTANWLNFTSTFTATANNQYALNFTGTLTARNTASDSLTYSIVNPTLVAAANSQVLRVLDINPTFTNGAFSSVQNIALRATSGSVLIGHTTLGATTTRLQVRGIGTTTGNLALFEDLSGNERLKILDNGTLASTVAYGTTTASNQIASNEVITGTMRAIASDNFFGKTIKSTVTIGSTSQSAVGLHIDMNYIQEGGLSMSSFNTFTTLTGTLSGMTPGTYTNVPVTSSNGSGALFNVTVNSATSITYTAVTAAGSGYRVGTDITFSGSSFGGSGSASTTVYRVTTKSMLSSSALRISISGDASHGNQIAGSNNLGVRFKEYYLGGTLMLHESITNGGYGVAAGNIFVNAGSSTYSITSGQFNVFSGTFINGNTSINGSLTVNNNPIIHSPGGASNGGYAIQTTAPFSVSSLSTQYIGSGIKIAASQWGAFKFSNSYQAYFHTTNTSNVVVGAITAFGSLVGGTGYTNGATYSFTGGSGSGGQCTVTATAGVVTSVNITNRGSNYAVGDVLTINGGGGNATITLTGVDYNSNFISDYRASLSFTDARSINNYVAFHGDHTYNITSTQSGVVRGFYWNPTITNLGSFTHLAFHATSGSVLIGHTTLGATTTRLQVRGIGTTTGNLALFEDNSGQYRMIITDNGSIYVKGQILWELGGQVAGFYEGNSSNSVDLRFQTSQPHGFCISDSTAPTVNARINVYSNAIKSIGTVHFSDAAGFDNQTAERISFAFIGGGTSLGANYALQRWARFTSPTVNGRSSTTRTITKGVNVVIGVPIANGVSSNNGVITTSIGLEVEATTVVTGAGSVTDGYGAYFNGTLGATNNYALGLNGHTKILDGFNIELGTTTGTKIGTATTQKLGFWNATPVVQPTNAITAATFVANTSGIVDDSATWGGYTAGQIVAALKQIGILA